MAFNDGDPIDAAQLTALETKLKELEGKIPQVGTPGSTSAVQMYGGVSGDVDITPGTPATFTIDYSAAKLSSTPVSVMLTPLHSANKIHIDFYVISANSANATCGAFVNTSSTTGTSVVKTKFSYFVVCN